MVTPAGKLAGFFVRLLWACFALRVWTISRACLECAGVVRYIRRERKAGVTARVLAEKSDLTTTGIYYAAAEGWRGKQTIF
jgi:hypothetical protein